MPRPITSDFLEFIAIRSCQKSLALFTSGSIHLIAVANSGIPIATAIIMYRRIKQMKGYEDDELSIVDPNRQSLILGSEIRAQSQIIVDNSIKSIRTLHYVLRRLSINGLLARQVFKLIDYHDVYEQELTQRLYDEGLVVSSAFDFNELIESSIPGRRQHIRTIMTRNHYRRIS